LPYLFADLAAEDDRVFLTVEVGDVAAHHPELQGVRILARSTVAYMLGAGNRDSRKPERPNEFDIFRTDNNTGRPFRASADHLTFGDGRHFCAGAILALKEMTIATA
jgi:cytochrome P450